MKRTIILTLLILVAAAGFSQGPPGPPPFDEEKIEVTCPQHILEKVLDEVKKVHPYEEPVIDIYPLLNTV